MLAHAAAPLATRDPGRWGNLIPLGLEENESLSNNKGEAEVEKTFKFLAGYSVPLKDLIWLGDFKRQAAFDLSSHRPCPLLIKLCTKPTTVK